jgi:hypothetical protein
MSLSSLTPTGQYRSVLPSFLRGIDIVSKSGNHRPCPGLLALSRTDKSPEESYMVGD